MRRALHYRRFHRLYLDVVVVVIVGALGWWVWPSGPTGRGGSQLPTPSLAYGDVDPRTVGSLLYPGHFAFSSPIGFGGTLRQVADSRWSVGSMLPFTPPLARVVPAEPADPAARRPDLPPIPAQRRTHDTESELFRVPPGEFLAVESDPALRSRGFALPSFSMREIVGTNAPTGEVRAYVLLAGDGQVQHVVFPPGSGVTWLGLRPLEGVIARAAASGGSPTGGWVRIRWQLAAGNP